MTMKSKVILLSPGYFSSADFYCQKRWRRVQKIANKFWSIWRKEFLQTLQEQNLFKSRWQNFKNGDFVLWKLKLIEIFGRNFFNRTFEQNVRLKLGSENNVQWEVVRTTAKSVLLVEIDSPTESEGLNQN